MKCLSVRQPWASLICAGVKDVELRNWKPQQNPGKILIHASSRRVVSSYGRLPEFYDSMIINAVTLGLVPELNQTVTSAIIGYVEVADFVEESNSPWAEDGPGCEWKWVLKNAHLFKTPIPYNGKLNLFNVPEIDENNLPETVERYELSREGTTLFFPVSNDIYNDPQTVDIAQDLFLENQDLFLDKQGNVLKTEKIVLINQLTGERCEKKVADAAVYDATDPCDGSEKFVVVDQFGNERQQQLISYEFGKK